MALTISQIFSASYEAVEKKKAADQWSESAFLREAERQGMIKRESLGTTLDETLDYRRNAGAAVLSTDLQPISTTKTEVLTAASFAVASVIVPVNWSKEDEAKNPTENQKIDLVNTLINNALASHDDLLEATLFTGANGLVGFDTMITEDGTGTVGGIVAGTETWWKNKFDEWTDETDIEETLTAVHNACMKGSGSALGPRVLVSDATTQAVFEGTQQAFQRYIDSDDMKAGFKTLAFKNSRWVFSQHCPAAREAVYFLNPKSYRVRVSKQAYRMKGKVQEFDNAAGYRVQIYSALNAVTDNRSRLGIAFS